MQQTVFLPYMRNKSVCVTAHSFLRVSKANLLKFYTFNIVSALYLHMLIFALQADSTPPAMTAGGMVYSSDKCLNHTAESRTTVTDAMW